ncbi:hypothetical protein [Streptosporangium sp. H16]|uniref:hypothetical protein n=1 Tax=Streptosporangium sp. H16 TaxID=3444184 RepID=UPI003F793EC2
MRTAVGGGAEQLNFWVGNEPAGFSSSALSVVGIVFGLGFVLSFGYWTTNFVEVQRAMATRSMTANELGAISPPGQGAAFVAAGTAFVVDIAVSVLTTAKPVSELRGLVFSGTPKQLRTDPAATRLLLRAHIDRYGAAGDGPLFR